jgi:hypothetical protein
MEKPAESLNSSNITSSPHLPSLTSRINPNLFTKKHHARPSLSPIGNTVSNKALKIAASDKSHSPAMDISKSVPSMKGFDREHLRQMILNERTKAKQNLQTNPYPRDISHLRDKKEAVAVQRSTEFKETFIEPPKPSQYLPINPEHLKSLVQNSDGLGIPRVLTSAGTPNVMCCKREKCLHIVEIKSKGRKNFKSAYDDFLTKNKQEAESKLSILTTFHDKVLTPIAQSAKEIEEDFVFLGAPTGRQEVENLRQWFELMKSKYLEKSEEEIRNLLNPDTLQNKMELCSVIYQAGLKDLVRQVSVHCLDRGELLREILDRYYELWSVFSAKCKEDLEIEVKNRTQDIDELQNTLSEEIKKRKVKVHNLKRNLALCNEELNDKTTSYQQLQARYDDLKEKHAANVKYLMRKQNQDIKKMVHRNIYTDYTVQDSRYADESLVTPQKSVVQKLYLPNQDETSPYTNRGRSTNRDSELPSDRPYNEEIEDIFIEASIHGSDSSIGFNDASTQTIRRRMFDMENNTDIIFFSNKDQVIQVPESELLETVPEEISNANIETTQNEAEDIQPSNTPIKISKSPKKKSKSSKGKESGLSKSPAGKRSKLQLSVSPSPSRSKSSAKGLERRNTMMKSRLSDREISRNEDELPQNLSQRSVSMFENSVDSTSQLASRSKSRGDELHGQESSSVSEMKIHRSEKRVRMYGMGESSDDELMAKAEAVFDSIKGIDKNSRPEEINAKLYEVEKLNSLIKRRARKLKAIDRSIQERKNFINSLKVDIDEFQNNQAAIELSPRTLHGALPSPFTILKSLSIESASSSRVYSRLEQTRPNQSLSQFTSTTPENALGAYSESAQRPDLMSRSSNSPVRLRDASSDISSKPIPQITPDGIDFSTFDPIKQGLVPAGADVISWQAGYSLGYEQGKYIGLQDGEEIGYERGKLDALVKEAKETGDDSKLFEEESDDEFNTSSSSLLGSKKLGRSSNHSPTRLQDTENKKKTKSTKFQEFLFLRPETRYRKEHPSSRLLEKIISKDMAKMSKYARFTRKMLYKHFSNTYQTIITKQKAGEKVKYLSCFVYDDFMQKYGLKKVADRKFTELVVSVLSFINARRVAMFARLFGVGHKIEMKNYSSHSFEMYKNCLTHIYSSKVGIVISFEETSDKQMIPTIRALECVREATGNFMSPGGVQRLLIGLDKFSVPDPKRINPSGIIEQELVLEVILDAYEEFQGYIRRNLTGLADCFTATSDTKVLHKSGLAMIMRYISSSKYTSIFSKVDDETEAILPERKKLIIKLPEDEHVFKLDDPTIECFLVPRLTDFCIKNSIFTHSDFESFMGPVVHASSSSLDSHIRTIRSEVSDLLTTASSQGKSLYKFPERMSILDEKSSQLPKLYLLATWRIYKHEISRLLAPPEI